MQEEEIIQLAHQFPRFHKEVSLGIEDDAALFMPTPGYTYAWCVDTLVENTHFLKSMPAHGVGWKSLAVNLSDLAAMNAEPLGCLLSLGLPAHIEADWISAFFTGLKAACETYRVDLMGGDTVKQEHISISVSVLGKSKKALTRRGARAGDSLVVTGTQHGAAAAGLREFLASKDTLLLPEKLSRLQKAQLYPAPRFQAAQELASFERTHVLDTSDSLLKSARLLAMSGKSGPLGYALEARQIPGYVCADHPHFFADVLRGGEDFELLAAVPPNVVSQLSSRFRPIGTLTEDINYTLHHQDNTYVMSVDDEGYKHFE